jgi:nucleotide-binding universal stress UspA family protein
MKTILVPLDGSALAEQVLPSVRLLATMLKANVHLLRVISDDKSDQIVAEMNARTFPVLSPLTVQMQREQHAWDLLMQGAENYLAGPAIQLREAGIVVQTEVRPGFAAEQIIAAAASEQTVLIAMATHGYSGLRRWRLGSVTDKVVHAATTPVLIVRGAADALAAAPTLKHILVPLDGSDLARQALPIAVDLARAAAADITLLQVVDVVPEADPRARPHGQATMQQAAAMQELTDLSEQLGQQITVSPLVEVGYPAEVIVDSARAHQVDLIAMATHGYTGSRRWALGSVADKVLHATTTPLLLVRAGAR